MKYRLIILFVLCALVSHAEVLSLDSCLSWARQRNCTIQSAMLDVEVSRQVQHQVLTKFFPQVQATALGTMMLNPLVDIDVTKLHVQGDAKELLSSLYSALHEIYPDLSSNIRLLDATWSVGVNAVQPLYAGGRIANGYKLSKVGVEAAQAQARVTERDVLQQVEETYWLIVGLQNKRQTVQAAFALLDTVTNVANEALAVGVIASNDMLRINLKRNELETKALQLTNGIDLASRMLCVLIGIEPQGELLLEPLPAMADELPDMTIRIENRPEYDLLDMNVRAERLRKKMIVGEALPTLALGMTTGMHNFYNRRRETLEDGSSRTSYVPFRDDQRFNLTGFAMLQLPLTGWWETSHKIKQQNLKIRKAELMQTDLTDKLRLQNEQARNGLTEAIRLAHQNESAVRMALENYRMTLLNYEAGLGTMAELMEAHTLLLQAENACTDAQITYRNMRRKYDSYNQ